MRDNTVYILGRTWSFVVVKHAKSNIFKSLIPLVERT